MRETRSKSIEQLKPNTPLRRSPRFHHANATLEGNPGTPTPVKKRSVDSLPIDSSITKKHRNGDGIQTNWWKERCESRRVTRSGKEYGSSKRLSRGADVDLIDSPKKFSGKKERRATGSKKSEKSGKGVRQSARLDRAVDPCENGEVPDLDKQNLVEKRVTRSMVCDRETKHGKVNGFCVKGDSGGRARVLSNERRANAGIGSCKITMDNGKQRSALSLGTEKVVRSSNCRNKLARGDRKPVVDAKNFRPCRSRQDAEKCNIVKDMGEKGIEMKTSFREDMKRDQVEEESENVQGWTKNQDLALREAYLTAKPTPQFWKKVEKMVPGKSAEECFNRIQSDYSTPSVPRMRSRANSKKPASPLSFSASKLLKKTVNLRSRRRTTLLAQKTVRQLLEKQQTEDQDYQADFFAFLEPTADPISFNFHEDTTFASPAANQKSSILTRFGEASSSVHKKHRSRLANSRNAAFVSPPVLKQVKNKALHERYIDQLHCRDAKRKAESVRMQKCIEKQNGNQANGLTANSVKVARDALVFNAYDAISQIRSLQSNANDNAIDGDDTSCSIEDDDEL